jgi:hypothetical protein
VLNLIYVFNSFPVGLHPERPQPGFSHDTSITFSYKLALQERRDTASGCPPPRDFQRRPDPAGGHGLPTLIK